MPKESNQINKYIIILIIVLVICHIIYIINPVTNVYLVVDSNRNLPYNIKIEENVEKEYDI